MKRIEKRSCSRFNVPGASVAVSRRRWFGKGAFAIGELKDLSRGGACLLAPERIGTGARVGIEIVVPDEAEPLSLSGRVCWSWLHPSGSFEVGVEFDPYGDEPGANPRVVLQRIVALESLYSPAASGWRGLSLVTPRRVDMSSAAETPRSTAWA